MHDAFFFLRFWLPPISTRTDTLVPNATLFRSHGAAARRHRESPIRRNYAHAFATSAVDDRIRRPVPASRHVPPEDSMPASIRPFLAALPVVAALLSSAVPAAAGVEVSRASCRPKIVAVGCIPVV